MKLEMSISKRKFINTKFLSVHVIIKYQCEIIIGSYPIKCMYGNRKSSNFLVKFLVL